MLRHPGQRRDDVAAKLLRAADEDRADDEIVDLLERRADDGWIVLAVHSLRR